MIRYAIPAVVLAAALPMTAQAAEIQIAATGPVVELTVMEEVDAAPDMVTVSAGVSSEAPTAVEALRQNSRAMRSVIERIKSLGVAEREFLGSAVIWRPRGHQPPDDLGHPGGEGDAGALHGFHYQTSLQYESQHRGGYQGY